MRRSSRSGRLSPWLMLAAVPLVAAAAEPPEGEAGAEATTAVESHRDDYQLFEELMVVGSADALQDLAGSGHVLKESDLARQRYQDIHRVLRQVPGINIQEEDGFGLRPNIGIRGTGVERSSKVTLLEDGVLIAPAPYAAPAAYYAPTAGRMQGFEVVKGAAAIRQGPYTNGGAINYLSTAIPRRFESNLEVAAGSDGMRRLQGRAGSSGVRTGWLVEAYDLEHGGFKVLDDGGPTGFTLSDYLGKFRLQSKPTSRRRHAIELKVGRTDQAADETYLGLTAADFERDPYRRYAGSSGDRIVSEHDLAQLSYEWWPSDRVALTVTAYRTDFFRNWAKLQSVGGVGVAAVLDAPGDYADELAILRGEADSAAGELRVRNNRRDYDSAGLQAVAAFDLDAGRFEHDLEIGLRLHEDREDRFQEEDLYRMEGGRRLLDGLGRPGSQSNRIATAEAVALFIEDTIRLGRWTVTPGARVESIDLRRLDFGGDDAERRGLDLALRANSITELIPGVGASYALNDDRSLFAGVHRGFSPPGPGSTESVDAEESVNWEAGYRRLAGSERRELVVFYNDYDNLLGTDTASGGGAGTGDQFNGGAATIAGLEAGYANRFSPTAGTTLALTVSYTYTHGQFDSSFETSFADWAPRVTAGDHIPYLPEHQLLVAGSVEFGGWGVHLDVDSVGEARTTAGRGPLPADRRLDARAVLDLKVDRELGGRWDLYGQLLNLTDEVFVAARRPAGLRPGRPRTFVLGVRARFGE